MNTPNDFSALKSKRDQSKQEGDAVVQEAVTVVVSHIEPWVDRFTEMDAAQWMAAQYANNDITKLAGVIARTRQEWRLLGEQMTPALDELGRKLQDPETCAKLNAAVSGGATVGEISYYLLAPMGEVEINHQCQGKQLRAIEDRIYRGKARALGEKSITVGMMIALPTTVAGAGIAVAGVGIALPLLGVVGAAVFLSAPLAAIGAGVAALATPRTIASLIKAKKLYSDTRTLVPYIDVLGRNNQPLDSATMSRINSQLLKIPHSDRHLFKHLGPHEMRIFLLGDDDTKRSILESNPPSQLARMEADISAIDQPGWRNFYQFLKSNIDPGIKSSHPNTLDGGIENLQEKLNRWRAGGTVELPGRRDMSLK